MPRRVSPALWVALCLSLLLSGCARPVHLQYTAAGSAPELMAVYEGWFGLPSHISVGYSSHDPAKIQQQIEEAKGLGISAFLMDWYGDREPYIDQSYALLQTTAAKDGFHVAMMYDETNLEVGAADEAIADLTAFRNKYLAPDAPGHEAYLTYGGRPLIFVFPHGDYTNWDQVRAALNQWKPAPFLIQENLPGKYASAFDGFYAWVHPGARGWSPSGANWGEDYLSDFYGTMGKEYPDKIIVGGAWSQFDDHRASWGQLAVPGRTIPILAARVAPEFFQVLDLRAATGRTLRAGDEQNCGDCVVLSNEIWRLQFGADPAVVGRQITLDGSPRTVIGVVPRNFHLLSPEIAVWGLLDSRLPPFSNFVERIGAVARMRPGVTVHKLDLNLADLTENAGYVFPASMLTVTSGRAEIRRYFVSYCFFALIAVACAGLIVYLRWGAALGRAPLTLRDRLRWWSFFAAKSFLLLTLMGLVAWSAVRVVSIFLYGSVHPMANGVALWVFLGISVAPLSWAIYDQQRRCRVCLSRLGTPIQIGAPGHVLLDWSGTEMVCPQGHGVLYLPDSQANWLERDRWNNLDQSWADLFRDS